MILLDPLARPVIGHRGNRIASPENTIHSMLEAVALGVDALEFDLHVSSDDVLMVMHDPTLSRTTNGQGAVSAHTAATLKALDAGACFTADGGRTYPYRGHGIGVPSFDDVVDAMPSTLPLIIELKTLRATPLIRDAVRRHGIAKRVIVAGFDAAAVRPLRGEGFALGAATADVAALLLPAITGRRVQALPYEALCIPPTHRGIPLPIGAIARSVRSSGTVMHLWTINSAPHALRLWKAGVQGIISDDPATIMSARSRAR
ncbi:MAG: glycerophosphodiester phosphodiesterase family protein [Gemmatimonadota bacterium]